MVLVAAACSRSRAAGVANGGFENGLDGWTADGAVAVREVHHTGNSCAGGPVGGKGWSLAQTGLRATGGHTYRIDAWVRASGAATLSLWTEERGKKDAARAAAWDDVPAEWTAVSAYVNPTHNDMLTIRFAASASDGGDASAFVDDVSLTEATLPVTTQVEPGKGFDDEPSMARAADGSIGVAWISWRDGGDFLQLARFAATSVGGFDQIEAWQVVGGPAISVLRPRVMPGVNAGCLVEEADGWHVLNQRWEDRSTGRTNDVGKIAATWSPGREAPKEWIGNGATAVWTRVGAVGFELAADLSNPTRSDVQLTRAPTIHRNPTLVRRDDETWLLYENVETPGYRVNSETMRRVVVAKLDGDNLMQPKDYAATSPLWQRAESPSAAFDDKGRLWIAYLRPRLPTAGWEVWLTGWTGAAWVQPIPVSSKKGMNRRPSLVIDGDRAIVCFQADDLPEGWSDIDRTKDSKSGVFLASVPLPDVPAAPQQLEPLVENKAPWEAAEIRKRFGDDAPVKHDTTVGGEKVTLLFGDLHSHSDTSVCDRLQNGSADDVYAMQRDFLHLDFACLTDHAEDMTPYLWNRQAKLARANDVPGKFTTFLGFEWTSGYDGKKPAGWYGHRNVILGDLRFRKWWSPRDHQTPAQLWDALRAEKANFVTIPHQLADTGNVPTDWSFTDETAQPVAEIFQVRGSYEAPGAPRVGKKATASEDHFLQGALKKGVVVGVIASPDHGGGVGKACVWAKENSREAILDALRARRCYGTTGARIALDVRVAGHFMGEKSADGASGPVAIEVRATCPNDVAKVSICRGGAWVHEETPSSRAFSFTWTDADAPPGPKWYYVRVEQKDGELAWSSPVWLGATPR